jgi:hypothetical protein
VAEAERQAAELSSQSSTLETLLDHIEEGAGFP